jgi:hypothetical protein
LGTALASKVPPWKSLQRIRTRKRAFSLRQRVVASATQGEVSMSSSSMVTTALDGVPIAAPPVGEARPTVKVSSLSLVVSSSTCTCTCLAAVSPSPKETVPLVVS